MFLPKKLYNLFEYIQTLELPSAGTGYPCRRDNVTQRMSVADPGREDEAKRGFKEKSHLETTQQPCAREVSRYAVGVWDQL